MIHAPRGLGRKDFVFIFGAASLALCLSALAGYHLLTRQALRDAIDGMRESTSRELQWKELRFVQDVEELKRSTLFLARIQPVTASRGGPTDTRASVPLQHILQAFADAHPWVADIRLSPPGQSGQSQIHLEGHGPTRVTTHVTPVGHDDVAQLQATVGEVRLSPLRIDPRPPLPQTLLVAQTAIAAPEGLPPGTLTITANLSASLLEFARGNGSTAIQVVDGDGRYLSRSSPAGTAPSQGPRRWDDDYVVSPDHRLAAEVGLKHVAEVATGSRFYVLEYPVGLDNASTDDNRPPQLVARALIPESALRAKAMEAAAPRLIGALLFCLLLIGLLAGTYIRRLSLRNKAASADMDRLRLVQAYSAELHASRKQLEAILNGNPAPVLVVDTAGRCTHWNAACEKFFGLPASRVIGTNNQWQAFYDNPRPTLADLIVQGCDDIQAWYPNPIRASGIAEGGVEYEGYYESLGRWLHITAAPLRNEQGKVVGAVETLLDISAQREAQAQAVAAKDQAEQATRAKSIFLANMSHEIRTPMNAIMGLTHILRRDAANPAQAEKLGLIAHAADHLLAVINDILDISKIEAGKVELERIDFDLDNLLGRIASIIAPRAREKGLEFIVDASGLPNRLNGDPTRLGQALINYLSNAIKFTERGAVVLRGHVVREQDGLVELRFEIEDSGIGISAEHLTRLFQAFAQADSSTTRQYGGTGLGLAITRHLAELMGGEAGAISTPGEGSTFWFTALLGRVDEASHPRDAVFGPLRALVVDDVPMTQMVHSQILRQLGLRPCIANSGQAAVDLVSAASQMGDAFDVLFIDLNMPDMDGLATLRRIHALTMESPPSCVLVTSTDDENITSSALAAGFRNVILKPASRRTFRSALEEIFGMATKPGPTAAETVQEAFLRRFPGTRVLLMEDEEINQMVAEDFLVEVGCVVTLASNGQEGLELARKHQFDLILTDMQMPVLDGLAATRAIRQLDGYTSVPIVAMTANAFAEDRRNCLAAGMNDFIAKPVDPDKLVGVMLKLLDRA